MKSLADFIYWDNKPFSQVTDEEGMQRILYVAKKLEPIEQEILKHPDGSIRLGKNKTMFIDELPKDLVDKIYQLLT